MTIKEILVHIVDDERVYAYRAMSFARGEKRSLPGFEQDDDAKYSGANERDLDNIFEEYEAVRRATITLFNGLPEESLTRKGTGSSNYHAATVRALAHHIAGHELRHVNIIKEAGEGFAENKLVGRRLRVGSTAEIMILERDPRCKMISLDPETGEHNPEILRLVAKMHDAFAGVYCAVLVERILNRGDSIRLSD